MNSYHGKERRRTKEWLQSHFHSSEMCVCSYNRTRCTPEPQLYKLTAYFGVVLCRVVEVEEERRGEERSDVSGRSRSCKVKAKSSVRCISMHADATSYPIKSRSAQSSNGFARLIRLSGSVMHGPGVGKVLSFIFIVSWTR